MLVYQRVTSINHGFCILSAATGGFSTDPRSVDGAFIAGQWRQAPSGEDG